MLKSMSGKDLLFGNSELSLITARFTAWVESALLGGWGMVLSLKFRMTFAVAFHTADQEAPGNNDRATQSDVPGSLFPPVPPSKQFPRRAGWTPSEASCGGTPAGHGDSWGQSSRGSQGLFSLGNCREVWGRGAPQKIDGRTLVPPKCFSSAWEGR